MSFQSEVSYQGAKSISTLSGQLIIKEKEGQLLLRDSNDYRLLIGVAPDGNIVVALTKVGEDLFEAYGV